MNHVRAQLEQTGKAILSHSRNELYVSMRFMDIALSMLGYEMNLSTKTIGVDGSKILYNPRYLIDLFRDDEILVNRVYMHMILHGLFGHAYFRNGRNEEYWSLACDIAVASILDSMPAKSVRQVTPDFRAAVYSQLKKDLKVLNAEGIYRILWQTPISPQQFEMLKEAFIVDDHQFWESKKEEEEQETQQRQNNQEKWDKASRQIQTGMETMMKKYGTEAGELLYQLQISHHEKTDLKEFFRKFAVLSEEIKTDDDSFDYIFYTYGLQRYENMPLIEPLEYKEVKKTEEFVIVIDTSESCPPEAVKAFLEEACSALTDSETFFRKVNIHILQCDVQVVSDVRLTSKEEVEKYMADVTIQGGGGTDFRPAFAYIDSLIQQGEFQNLKGMVYLTDGIGQYPAAPPAYDVAFAMLDDQAEEAKVPSWAIRLDLDSDELREAFAHSRAAEDDSDNKHLEDI